MSQKSAKSAAQLESMIMAELREHPSAGVVVIRPKQRMLPGTLFCSARGRKSTTHARRGSRK
jgi:hypothetical protein